MKEIKTFEEYKEAYFKLIDQISKTDDPKIQKQINDQMDQLEDDYPHLDDLYKKWLFDETFERYNKERMKGKAK